MKCAHPENKRLKCKWDFCPLSFWKTDWFELTGDEPKCSYIRSDKWIPKEEKLEEIENGS